MAMIFYVMLLLSIQKNGIIENIIEKSNAKEDEVVIAVYFQTATCAKCYIEPLRIIEKVKQLTDNKLNIIAIVECDRDIELKAFVKKIDWKHNAIRDKNNIISEINKNSNIIMTIIDVKSKRYIDLELMEHDNNIAKTRKFLRKK